MPHLCSSSSQARCAIRTYTGSPNSRPRRQHLSPLSRLVGVRSTRTTHVGSAFPHRPGRTVTLRGALPTTHGLFRRESNPIRVLHACSSLHYRLDLVAEPGIEPAFRPYERRAYSNMLAPRRFLLFIYSVERDPARPAAECLGKRCVFCRSGQVSYWSRPCQSRCSLRLSVRSVGGSAACASSWIAPVSPGLFRSGAPSFVVRVTSSRFPFGSPWRGGRCLGSLLSAAPVSSDSMSISFRGSEPYYLGPMSACR